MTNQIVPEPRQELIVAASDFYKQGWMVGTAGNLSAKLADDSFWITASGLPKGQLLKSDFVRIYPDGKVETSSPHLKPSAETAIHQLIYNIFPKAQACYHIHSIESNIVSRFVEGDTLPLPPLEMIKGFGVWAENPDCDIPIFANHLEIPLIVAEISDRFRVNPPQIPALLIRDHGLTVWASSQQEARNYIELVNYIFGYMITARRMGVSEKEYAR
jgi:methylthioribulose-1-phosphate dehydratase